MNDDKTYRDFRNIVLVLICVLALVCIGCRGLLDRGTPADVHPSVSSYLELEHQEFTSLFDLKLKQDAIRIKHRDVQTDLLREAQDDEVQYSDAITFIETSIEQAQVLQDIAVGSEDQPLSILGLLAGFTGGAAIGRAIKRKGDYSSGEVRELVAKAKTGGMNG
jgi:hypothetical protein